MFFRVSKVCAYLLIVNYYTLASEISCSHSYLPNKSYDVSSKSLNSFQKVLHEELGVELKFVQEKIEPKLNQKFLLINEAEYKKFGLSHLRASVLNLSSNRFDNILMKKQVNNFNKLYRQHLRLSGTSFIERSREDLGTYFIIKPIYDGTGSYLNRFSGWVKKRTGSDLIVSSEYIFKSGDQGAYFSENNEIYISLDEAIWGNFLEDGTSIHELAHAIFEHGRSRGINSLFSTSIHYLIEQVNVEYSEFLSYEEIYAFSFNLERSLFNIKKEYETGGDYLKVNNVEYTTASIYFDNEIFFENLNLIQKYTRELKKSLLSNEKSVMINSYEIYTGKKNGFGVDLRIQGDIKIYDFEVFLKDKINVKKMSKNTRYMNKFFKSEVLKMVLGQEKLLNDIREVYRPLHKKISALGEDGVILSKDISNFHSIAQKLRKLIRGK